MMGSMFSLEPLFNALAFVIGLFLLGMLSRHIAAQSKLNERKQLALKDPEKYRLLCDFEDNEKARKQKSMQQFGTNAVKATLFGINLFKKR